MKITIISGSTRVESRSAKVAGFIQASLEGQLGQNVYLLDLAKTPLKYWDETFWSNHAEFDSTWNEVRQHIIDSDALVVVAPEWNGMIPPALKNFFHLAVKGEIANKPGLLVSVSAGINGVYPITELRLNSYKNTFLCYIPQHVIVRNAGNVLNDLNMPSDKEDEEIRQRILYSLNVLVEYAKAFCLIRKSDIILNNNKYPNGM